MYSELFLNRIYLYDVLVFVLINLFDLLKHYNVLTYVCVCLYIYIYIYNFEKKVSYLGFLAVHTVTHYPAICKIQIRTSLLFVSHFNLWTRNVCHLYAGDHE